MTTPNRDEVIQEILETDESDTWQVDHLLDLGLSKKEIMALGFSDPLYRQRAKKRAKEGKPPPSTGSAGPSIFPAITKGTEQVLPEYLSGQISEYFDGSEDQQRIFKAGIMVPLLGMRLFAEMVKPLSVLINSMKGDQMDSMMKALALGQEQAHSAAMEASQATAAQILASQKEAAIIGAKNPMQAAMTQSMMPMITNLMSKLMGGLIPGAAPQTGGLPTDWTMSTEK